MAYLKEMKLYYLDELHGDAYLTQREAECMHLLLKGYNIEKIAQEFNLSQQVVEYYLKNIKLKLHCDNLEILNQKVAQTGFLNIFAAENV